LFDSPPIKFPLIEDLESNFPRPSSNSQGTLPPEVHRVKGSGLNI